MALSLSISTSQGTQSVANNTTKLTVNVNISWTYGSYDHYGSSKYVTINGKTYYFSSVKINPNRTSSGSQTLYSTTVTIPHNADGTKTVSIYASVTTATSSGTVTASRSVTLTTIPRATTPSLSASSVALGSAVTISTPRASSAFTHTLTYKFGSATGTIATGVGTSYAWTVPKTLANQIPSATSGTCTITCRTYNGSSLVGTKTVNVTLKIPNTAEFKPTVGTVSISEAVQAVTTAFGSRYVQGLSQLNVSISASGAYGSTIRSYSTSVDGVTYNSATFTSNVINASGTLSVTVTVRDSRDRTASKTVNISVVEYKPPAITGMSYQQCDADGTANPTGTSTKITITGQVSSVSSQNSRTLTLKWKKSTDSAYQTRTLTTSDWEFTVSTIVNSTTPDETYEFVAVLEDKINTVENAVTTGIIAMSFLAGGKGVRLFGEAEDTGFWVDKIDYTITEEEYDEQMALIGGSTSGKKRFSTLFKTIVSYIKNINSDTGWKLLTNSTENWGAADASSNYVVYRKTGRMVEIRSYLVAEISTSSVNNWLIAYGLPADCQPRNYSVRCQCAHHNGEAQTVYIPYSSSGDAGKLYFYGKITKGYSMWFQITYVV